MQIWFYFYFLVILTCTLRTILESGKNRSIPLLNLDPQRETFNSLLLTITSAEDPYQVFFSRFVSIILRII